MSEEDKQTFWQMKARAAEFGISASLMGKLARACGDHALAITLLQHALCADKPVPYLGGVLSSLKREPRIVCLARSNNVSVERIKLADGTKGWKIGDAIYNREGIDVGG